MQALLERTLQYLTSDESITVLDAVILHLRSDPKKKV